MSWKNSANLATRQRGSTAQKTQSGSAALQFKPHKYQEKTIKFMIERPAAGAFLDPGLGKTVISYSVFEILKARKFVKSMLVVTVLRPAYQVWPKEIEKWGLNLSYAILHGKNKAKALRSNVDVYIINYEGLAWLAQQFPKGGGYPPFDMVVFDESSKLRNTNTQRFKVVRQMLRWFKRRYILTGTPTPKGLMNLFGQMYVLDNGSALGAYITHFRMRFCNVTRLGPYGPIEWGLKAGAAQQIYDSIKNLVIRFSDDELDMPQLIVRNIEVELPGEARLQYNQLEKELIVKIQDKTIIAKNAGIVTGKLRQIANGGVYIDGTQVENGVKKRSWAHIHDEKTDAVMELLEGLEGQPTLIGYEFHHDLERLRKVLPDVPNFTDMSMNDFKKAEESWNRGEIPIALAQISSIAFGSNLQGGRAVIFYGQIWDWELDDQFIRRIYRQGQKAKRVFVYRIIARNTIDEVVVKALSKKGATQQELFNALKEQLHI